MSADGSTITQNTPFSINGVAYPHNWLELASPQDLSEHGITVQELPDPTPVPATVIDPATDIIHDVTPRQARLALLGAGLLDQVEATVTAVGGAAKITWEYATSISRNDPLITSLGASLSLTDTQIDNLFHQARTL